MNSLPSHDSFDDLMAAALHGELSPEERAQFDSRITNDPAARAAYQEAQAMHNLLEKTHQTAQPDSTFEQRMVSGVRRKLELEKHPESAWESALFFWNMARALVRSKRGRYAALGCLALLVTALALTVNHDTAALRSFASQGIANPVPRKIYLPLALYRDSSKDLKKVIDDRRINYVETAQKGITLSGYVDTSYTQQFAGHEQQFSLGVGAGKLDFRKDWRAVANNSPDSVAGQIAKAAKDGTALSSWSSQPGGLRSDKGSVGLGDTAGQFDQNSNNFNVQAVKIALDKAPPIVTTQNGLNSNVDVVREFAYPTEIKTTATNVSAATERNRGDLKSDASNTASSWNSEWKSKESATNFAFGGVPTTAPIVVTKSGEQSVEEAVKLLPKPNDSQLVAANTVDEDHGASKRQKIFGIPSAVGNLDYNLLKDEEAKKAAAEMAAAESRKLVRNAQLDLEVKSFPDAVDRITVLTKEAGGYLGTSNSEKGGNGKLQGTVVVKVLPQNLDAFLIKLRDLGVVKNQSVSTADVTKDYFDTQARLENSRRMETQLQDLLKRENGKVSDLLQVERELGRVRGEIEQMQGQLKLYDFQVQYATVSMTVSEKDLNQAAAYLLKEQDDFSLFSTDVEGTFQEARQSADSFKAQVLTANLNHNSGSDVSAELVVMVAPDQIESFLGQVKGLGRVSNFTRQTQRIAKDGGDSDQPADQTLTEKDKVQVHLAIRSDDESRKQVALTVVAKEVDAALEQAKAAALANAGVEILGSSLNKTPQGQSTAQLSVRVPGKDYDALIKSFGGLGRAASLSIQRNDNSGPGANGDDAPVIVSLSLTDNDTPLQQTAIAVLAGDVDAQSQQIKKDAAMAGVEVKSSSFARQPDGTEYAQMSFRMPMAKYGGFLESVKKLGKMESLSVQRDDRPDQTRSDDTAPVEINLQLHNQRGIVAEDGGLWATLRQTFGEGAGALFGSIRVIGVMLAFVAPWAVTLLLAAWVGRRIYVWRKK